MTLANFSSWLSSIETGTTEHLLNPLFVKVIPDRASNSIRVIADKLTESATSIERDLLTKSLQETLLYCTGIDIELDHAELTTRLLHFLSTRGKSALIEQFLSLCIFNLVWFQIGEYFWIDARTLGSFERDIERVEQLCRRIVASAWSLYGSRDGNLGPGPAQELIRSIEDQLRGDGLEPHL